MYKENKQFFRATDPDSLLIYLKEKQQAITKLIPELKQIQSKVKEKVSVEIFRGEQGMKSVFKDIILKKQEVIGYGITGQLRKHLPEFAKYFFREQQRQKTIYKLIYTANVDIPNKYNKIKFLPKEYANTTVNLVCYGDTMLNLIWEPELIAIKIKSKELSDNFRRQFNLLWNSAKSTQG